MKAGRQLVELVVTVAVALTLALTVQAYAVKPYRIPTGSMEPTLQVGQRILVNRLAGTPHVGDVVVFHPPAGADSLPADCGREPGPGSACDRATPGRSSQNFVKRVVGEAGDRLSIRGGHVYRNGRRESDGYITPCGGATECDLPRPVVVPPHSLYLMGDNRGNSDDSRFWGPVDLDAIIGEAQVTYWPPGRLGGV